MSKPLHIAPHKKFKGLKVFCYQCGQLVNEECKETEKPIASCKFADRHRYKVIVHVPGTKNERRVKILETRDYDEAVKQAIDFQKSIKSESKEVPEIRLEPMQRDEISLPINESTHSVRQSGTHNLINLMARYVGYLHGDPEIVPEFRRRERSKKHLEDIERTFKYFVKSLKEGGYEVGSLNVSDVNEMMIGKFHKYLLKELELSNRTYNRSLTNFTSFYNYLIKEGYTSINPFLNIPRRAVTSSPEIIEQDEYNDLLEIVQKPELGVETLSNGRKKYLYKPWVKDAIELGLETGRRNEEIARMQWNEVHVDQDGTPTYIRVPDFKVNRQRGATKENLKYIYVPVTHELHELLERLGYEKYKGSDKYILAPEEEMDRDTVKTLMGRSFSHYYKQLETGKELSYKSLRKTYITHLRTYLGENTRLVTGHSGDQVIDEHYTDRKHISKTAKGFSVFRKNEKERESDIKEIREKGTDKTQGMRR